MQKVKLISILIFITAAFITPAFAKSKKFSGIYIFGDSISTDIIYQAGAQNDITSGTNWPSFLSDEILLPSAVYENHAAGGTWTSVILNSINGYLNSVSSADSNALYTVWGGYNDLINHGNTQNAVNNIVTGVNSLVSKGAEYILVSNLHNSAYTSTNAISEYNRNLLTALNNLKADSNIIQADTCSLLLELYLNPAQYGYIGEQVLSDALHFSSTTRHIVADYFYSIINAPSYITLLSEIPLSTAKSYENNILLNETLNHLNTTEKNKISFFANWSTPSSTTDETTYTTSLDGSGKCLIIGGDFRFPSYFKTGISLNMDSADVDFGDSYGSFSFDEKIYSVFGSFEYINFFIDLIASRGDLTYDSIERNVKLGSLFRINSGNTDGDYSSYIISSGIDLIPFLKSESESLNSLSVTPLLNYNSRKISVNGYTEDENLSTSMFFGDTDRDLKSFGYGLLINYSISTSIGRINYYGNIMKETGSEDERTDIQAGLKNLTGSSFELPGFEPESESLLYNIGLKIRPLKKLIINIYYSSRNGDKTKENSVNLGCLLTNI